MSKSTQKNQTARKAPPTTAVAALVAPVEEVACGECHGMGTDDSGERCFVCNGHGLVKPPKPSVAAQRQHLRALMAADETGEWSDDPGDGSIGSIVEVAGYSAIGQVMQRGRVRGADDLIERKSLTRQIAMLHNLTPGLFSELDGLRDVLAETRKLLASFLEASDTERLKLRPASRQWATETTRLPLPDRRRVKQTVELIDYALREEKP